MLKLSIIRICSLEMSNNVLSLNNLLRDVISETYLIFQHAELCPMMAGIMLLVARKVQAPVSRYLCPNI